MIKSFGDKETEAFWHTGRSKRIGASVAKAAYRRLVHLEAAHTIEDLRIPPSNRLEKLSGDRKGQYSIRVNKQWRIVFVWRADGAHDVKIVDYH